MQPRRLILSHLTPHMTSCGKNHVCDIHSDIHPNKKNHLTPHMTSDIMTAMGEHVLGCGGVCSLSSVPAW
jgi:hypothetical protein